ncbi:MAG: BrnA antitoxin family protein [Bradyrhizobium sp.]|nr:BrnA antitoxin family protein [Bradyrhizobium sp.]
MKQKPKTTRTRPAKRGFTAADMKAVSDNPAWTKETFARARPFSNVFPALDASIKRSRGRPKIESPKEAVTLRLPATTVKKFKEAGDDWRTKMAKVLERAKV